MGGLRPGPRAVAATPRLTAMDPALSIITDPAFYAVAVPASLAYNYLVGMIDRLVREMDESSTQLLGEIEKRRG